MVGLVIVSHSAKLAEGVAELAAQMAGPEVRIAVAGGLDEPGALGTDATRVLAAIDEAWSDDGVLVLLDLGSAVLSAGLAADLLDDERRERVLLTAAPLVEGAVSAAVAAGLGDSLDLVAEAARGGLAAKREQLGEAAHDVGGGAGGGPAAGVAPGPPVTGDGPCATAWGCTRGRRRCSCARSRGWTPTSRSPCLRETGGRRTRAA